MTRSENDPCALDVQANRGARKYSRAELAKRVLWGLVWPLFRLSPRPLWGWRRMLLRLFGAQIGPGAHIYPSVRITMPWNLEIDSFAGIGDHAILYALGPIRIGARSTVSQYAHLCAGSHDIASAERVLIKPSISVEADVWIATDAFIGPGVNIGRHAVIGARSVVRRDVASAHVVIGNPAQTIKVLET